MNKIEKFLFSTVEKWVLILTVFSMFLFAVFFGILVRQELIGSQKLGAISKAALFFAEIPVYVKQLGQDEIILINRFPETTGFIGQPLKKKQYLLLSRTHPILEVLDDYLLFQPSAADTLFVVSRVHHQEHLTYC